MLIYKATNLINGKIYIGKQITKDINDDRYLGSGFVLKDAIKKYGRQNFTKEIIYQCYSEEELNNKEMEIVNEEFLSRSDVYNIILGGNGSFYHLNYGKSKHKVARGKKEFYIKNKDHFIRGGRKSLSLKLGIHDPEIFGKAWTGRKHKEESKRKIGEKNAVHQKGEGNSQYGTCWIYHPEEKRNAKIKKEDIEIWIQKGWIKGRKIKQ